MKHNELLKELEKQMSRYGYCDTRTHIEIFIKEYEALTKDENPIRLKDVIKRIKEFDDGTKLKWTYDILKELGSDFASKMFHEGYQQGRFDEAVETHHEPEKVKIPQLIADWIEKCKYSLGFNLKSAMNVNTILHYSDDGHKVIDWIKVDSNQEKFARAWLDGYQTFEVEEKWKPIVGFYNEVSNQGRVRSVTHVAGNGKTYQGKILKPIITKSGYVNVCLTTGNDESKITKRVHRLVADAFIENPDDKDEINHKDGNKENNRAENLEWVTRSENEQHAYDNNLVKVLKGSEKPLSKLNEEDVRNIRKEYEDGCLQIELAERYGVARQTISSIVNRKAWTHVQ